MKIPSFLQSTNPLRRKKNVLWSFFCLLFSMNSFAIASKTDTDLIKKIHAIEKKTNTIMGITAIQIEKNEVVAHNNNKHFFMASTIKLPIALAFLHLVDEKKDSLSRMVRMDTNNSVPGSGSLYHLFEKKKINMSMKNVMNYMLRDSDNSASDTLLQAANGPVYVTKRMAALGFKNILINRSLLEMFLDTNHVDHSYLVKRRPVYELERNFNKVPLQQKVQAWERFQNDIRDTTTSDDMAKLLVKVYKKQALSESSTKVLLDIMEHCRTGRSRIRGLLPPQVKVAHKTGTWAIYEQKYLKYVGSKKLYRFASDVGIITLPHNKGHVAIAVYVKSRSANDYGRSRAIALASRAVYDHFMK